jgi:hypothetical protein
MVLGGPAAAGIAALCGPLAVVLYVGAVIRFTGPASRLGATAAGRLGWVLLVLAGGTGLWLFGWAFTDVAGRA